VSGGETDLEFSASKQNYGGGQAMIAGCEKPCFSTVCNLPEDGWAQPASSRTV
jgi:hypothetical protein